MTRALLFAPVLALAACDGGSVDDTDEGYEIADQILQGVVGGTAWTFAQGETDAFLSDDEDFFGELYATAYESCGFSDPGAPLLLLALPTSPGAYDLGLSQNVTFVPTPGENLIATDGAIRIDEVTATTVSGGLYVRYDDDNEVEGTFEVAICAE